MKTKAQPAKTVKPSTKPKTVCHRRMVKIFNEWARRYSEDPKSFSEVLNAKGEPVKNYGECCAVYFNQIASDMDKKGLLPKPTE